MKSYEQRKADAEASYARAMERIKTPVIDQRQKIPAGTEVYVRPIYDQGMLHFSGDLVTTVVGTYAQLYGGSDFNSYSLEIASWYYPIQLMPTNGMNIDQCRNACADYFGAPYTEMLDMKKAAEDACPLMQWSRQAAEEFAEALCKNS